jgi:hypothetical protein
VLVIFEAMIGEISMRLWVIVLLDLVRSFLLYGSGILPLLSEDEIMV